MRMPTAGPIISISSPAPDATWRPRRAGRVVIAGLLYLVVTIVCVGLPSRPGHVLLGIGDDPKSFVWFLEWWPWAILHARDPFWSHLVFAPGGYSMAWGTSVPTASLLAAPVTLVAGPVVSFNLLTLAARPLAALCGYLLADEVTDGAFAASLVGGSLFGFSGYENGQALGHLNLDLVFLLPLMVLLSVRRLRGTLGGAGFIGLLACVLLAQFGLSTEIFATALGAGAWTLFVCAAFGNGPERRAIVAVLLEAAVAAGVAVLAASPMLVSMLGGALEMPDFVNPASVYSNDLVNLIVPTMAEAVRWSWTDALAGRFSGNGEEQDLYVGLPLLAILLLWVASAPARRRAAGVVLIVGLIVASLGPVLHVGGRPEPVILPWTVVGHLPLIRGALPCRIGVFVDLAAAATAAAWIDRGPPWRLALGLAACLFLVPGSAGTARTPALVPCLFEPARLASVIPDGVDTLILPYGSGDSMLWQARSGMSLRQAGGLLSLIPRRFSREPLVLPLLRNEPMPGFTPALLAFSRDFDVRRILAGPGTSPALLDALVATGLKRRDVCGVAVFEVPGERLGSKALP